jgi:hypothetical protein
MKVAQTVENNSGFAETLATGKHAAPGVPSLNMRELLALRAKFGRLAIRLQ